MVEFFLPAKKSTLYIYIYLHLATFTSIKAIAATLPPLNTRRKTLLQPNPRLLPKELPQNPLRPRPRLDHRPIAPLVGRRVRDQRVVRPQPAEQPDDVRPVEVMHEGEDALGVNV